VDRIVAVGTRLLNFYGLRVNLFDCLKQSVPACVNKNEIFLLIRIVEDTCTRVGGVRVQRLRHFGRAAEIPDSRETTDRRRLIDINKQRLPSSAQLQRKHRRLGHPRPHVES
jgi:hypothetical protein